MSSLPEVRGARPGVGQQGEATALRHLEPAVDAVGAPSPAISWRGRRLPDAVVRQRYPLAVYAATRVLYLLIGVLDLFIRHDSYGRTWSLGAQMANWDGKWYLLLTQHGYPTYVSHGQTPLGFLPLYPMLTWTLGHLTGSNYTVAGVVISLLTGAAATILIGELARGWFGERAARRGVLFFCLFPGSIVFSMVYTEGLLLTLIAGCFLALQRRRWLLAGVLAGLSTAVGPVAVAVIPACGLAALLEMRRRGWLNPAGWKALVAPALAPVGLVGVAVFMWFWTGSPTAVYQAQRFGWHESSTPWAIPRLVETLIHQIKGEDKHHPNVDLNVIAGLLGTAFLIWALVLLWRNRRLISPPALVWTAGMTLLTVTSNATPPNARMLLCAFPLLLVVAAEVSRRAWYRVLASTFVLTVAMSIVTFVGTGLRP